MKYTAGLFLGASLAGSAWTLSMNDIAGQCADSSGFSSCWSKAISSAEQCYKDHCSGEGTCNDDGECTSSNPDCVQACSCVAYTDMTQCSLESCWNKVASCEYQNLMIQASENCPVAGVGAGNPFEGTWLWIPYYPTADDFPGACSCNIAYNYGSQRETTDQHTNCYNNAKSVTENIYACDCCAVSRDVSIFFNNCPNTDPDAVISLGDMPEFPYAALAASSRCDALLGDFDCGQIGFLTPSNTDASAPFLSGSSLPSNGTNGLSDASGELTTPVHATLVWAIGAGQPTMTAIAVTDGKSQSGSSGGGNSSSSGDGSSDSSGDDEGAGGRLSMNSVLLGVFVGLATLMALLS